MQSLESTATWFIAVLVVRARVASAAEQDELLDFQVRLVRASDPEAAYQSALSFGRAEGTTYRDADGEDVTWEFAGLHDLAELPSDGFEHGTEVYSWRGCGPAADAVMPKEWLSVFWLAANAHRTAGELLGDHRDPAG